MKMPSTRTMAIAAGATAGVIILSLLGWYLFLQFESRGLNELNEGRGLGLGTPTFMNPAGSTYANFAERVGGGVTATSSGQVQQTPRLWRVSVTPAAGIHIATVQAPIQGTSTPRTYTEVQFVDRATGNLFAADAATGEMERVTNTLIPNIQEAHWAGSRVILRYENENGQIETFSGIVEVATSTGESGEVVEHGRLAGVYLSAGIVDIAVHPAEQDGVIYVEPRTNGAAIVRAAADGTDAEDVFSSAIRGWSLAWHQSSAAALVQSPTANSANGAYTLSLASGALTPLVSPQRGMEALPNADGERTLVSTTAGDRPALFLQDEAGMRPLGVATFASKCVWNPVEAAIAYCAVPQLIPQNTYPDAWYRGEVHFSDTWWMVNVADGTAEQVIAPESEYGFTLDVIAPMMNDEGTHIAFLDATTRTPWVLRIEP